jgi:RAD50-interacting protein 1
MAATPEQQVQANNALDIRVEDYLDDRLQSTTDLETLDALLANVEIQRSQLQSQLADATKELEEARRTANDRQGSLVRRIEDFQKLQQSIDVRVKIAAASDAPSQAIARLQRPMKKLQTVDLARKYLVLLQDVENLRKETLSHLPKSPKAALEPYSRVKQLSNHLKELQGPADDAAVHLVNYVERVTESLWDEMKKTMCLEMETILGKRRWPQVDPQSEMDDEWLLSFDKMMDLQVPEVLYTKTSISLLPFDVMCKIFIQEFRFHFLSDKPTSKSQAIGTHCFPWFISLIEKWEDFFRHNVSQILVAKFSDTSAATNMVYVDPVSAFITTMLPALEEKVRIVAAEAVNSPTFLSSFLAQLMTFDENIRVKFNYDGGDAEEGWAGLATRVLDEHFEDWFKAEKAFALERFQSIIASEDARQIDYDYSGAGKTKPTHGAVRVADLLRSITAQYLKVRQFKHKIRFLIGIQLDILDGYHDRLRGSLEAYQAIRSTVGRTLHGVTKDQIAALDGVGAFETLCKVYGSADHIVSVLKEWSNEEVRLTRASIPWLPLKC